MDALTHLFLPLTVVYVLLPDRFTAPRLFVLGVFGLLPDADKFLGVQGTFHSVLLIGIVIALLLAATRYTDSPREYAVIIAALLASHLVLDLLDGGPIFLFAPGLSPGFGLTFPTTISLGASPTSLGVTQPLPEIHNTEPVRQGAATYTLITGYGVLSMLVFAVIVGGKHVRTMTRSANGAQRQSKSD